MRSLNARDCVIVILFRVLWKTISRFVPRILVLRCLVVNKIAWLMTSKELLVVNPRTMYFIRRSRCVRSTARLRNGFLLEKPRPLVIDKNVLIPMRAVVA